MRLQAHGYVTSLSGCMQTDTLIYEGKSFEVELRIGSSHFSNKLGIYVHMYIKHWVHAPLDSFLCRGYPNTG